MGALASYAQGDLGSAISNIGGVFKKVMKGGNTDEERIRRLKFSPADAILISGCKDDQTSADAYNAGTATGAMSYAFIEVMARNPNQSYISLLNEMRQVMMGKYTQKPQLSASHPIDMNLKFIL